jgi:hypothetical protein
VHDAGGAAPGCTPTREQINGDDPVYVITGFDYREGDLWTGEPWRSPFWRVYYGIVEGRTGAPARVVDTVSGRGAPVVRGRLFLLAVPSDPNTNALRLVAYDAGGKVVADDR